MFSTESMMQKYDEIIKEKIVIYYIVYYIYIQKTGDFQTVIERVEDKEDIDAAKQAEVEERNFQMNGNLFYLILSGLDEVMQMN